MKKIFRVTWTIDEFANSPEEAIAKAILAMPTPMQNDSMATVFDVIEVSDTGVKGATVQLDTLELEDEENERFLKVLNGEDEDDDLVELEKALIPVGTSVLCNGKLDEIIAHVQKEDKENYDQGYRYILKENGTQSEGAICIDHDEFENY